MRHSERAQIFHCVNQSPAGDMLVAFKMDLADLYLRAFFDHKRDSDSRRRNGTHFTAYDGVLPSTRGQ